MYTAQGTLTKDKQVAGYLPLVKRIAYLLMARLPASVEVDDLIQNGLIGLLDAMDRFEDGMGAQFETYAVQRIRGSMLDGLRENDWLPRSVRKEMRRVEEAIRVLEHENGRPPSEAELAKALGHAAGRLPEAAARCARTPAGLYRGGDRRQRRGLPRSSCSANQRSRSAEHSGGSRTPASAGHGDRGDLPEREKLMMSLYYEQDLNLREIGEVMGSPSRASVSLHSQAVARCAPAVGWRGQAWASGGARHRNGIGRA
jgi:RNA polymerase sigma factor for flagellar operon FliA